MQERSLHEKKRPLAEMIFVTNSLGAVILLAIAGSGGELALLHEPFVAAAMPFASFCAA